MRELQVGMGVAAEKDANFASFSGHNAPSRYAALLHGVGEMTAVLLAKDDHSHTGGAPSCGTGVFR
jgi:hypothetical protein